MALRKGKIQANSRLDTPGAYTFPSGFLKMTLRSLVSNLTALWTEYTGWCRTHSWGREVRPQRELSLLNG